MTRSSPRLVAASVIKVKTQPSSSARAWARYEDRLAAIASRAGDGACRLMALRARL
jgi:hypothetical protein